MSKLATTFYVFRYQLLPLKRHLELTLFEHEEIQNVSDIKEIIENKNLFLQKTVESLNTFIHPQKREFDINHKFFQIDSHSFAFRIGVNRKRKVENKDFEKEDVDDWPNFLVLFDNRKDKQIIAIEKNTNAFSEIQTFIRILNETINNRLKNYYLLIFIEPIFSKTKFWEFVEEHKGKIRWIDFELISPNMSNISRALKLDLHKLAEDTNTQKTNLKLSSDEQSSITPTKDNEQIASVVDYSAQGGGTIKVGLKNAKRKTVIIGNEIQKEVTVEEITIETDSPHEMEKILGKVTEALNS